MFFFFKQKTAYEMRISDWSSDVCSSDVTGKASPRPRSAPTDMFLAPVAQPGLRPPRARRPGHPSTWINIQEHIYSCRERTPLDRHIAGRPARLSGKCPRGRSEEHTSELLSLMRISYAVFCVKNK